MMLPIIIIQLILISTFIKEGIASSSSPTSFSSPVPSTNITYPVSLYVDQSIYVYGEEITVYFNVPGALLEDWIGLYPDSATATNDGNTDDDDERVPINVAPLASLFSKLSMNYTIVDRHNEDDDDKDIDEYQRTYSRRLLFFLFLSSLWIKKMSKTCIYRICNVY